MKDDFENKDEAFLKYFFERLNPIQTTVNIGKALISEPFLIDPHFLRSVVYLVEHNEKGSVGFVLNRPMGINVNDMVAQLPKVNQTLYAGGPVGNDQLFYMHCLGNEITHSVKVSKNLWWGGDIEDVQKLSEDGLLHQDNIKFFLGYSGWGAGQLEDELFIDSWYVTEMADAFVFQQMEKDLWNTVLEQMGKQYKMIANFPIDPALN